MNLEPGVDEWGNTITRVGANSAIIFGPDGGCAGSIERLIYGRRIRHGLNKVYKKCFTLAFEGMHLISWIDRHRVHDVPLATTKLHQPRDLHGHKRAETARVEIPRGTVRDRFTVLQRIQTSFS